MTDRADIPLCEVVEGEDPAKAKADTPLAPEVVEDAAKLNKAARNLLRYARSENSYDAGTRPFWFEPGDELEVVVHRIWDGESQRTIPVLCLRLDELWEKSDTTIHLHSSGQEFGVYSSFGGSLELDPPELVEVKWVNSPLYRFCRVKHEKTHTTWRIYETKGLRSKREPLESVSFVGDNEYRIWFNFTRAEDKRIEEEIKHEKEPFCSCATQ